MVDKNKKHEEDPEVVIENAIGETENFIMRNGRSLLIALVVVVVVVSGFFGYKYLVVTPRAEKASAMMFTAQQQFMADSFQLALSGDGAGDGFLQVIENYGSTNEGNLAKHYAGICYLKMGEYQKALDYLKQYTTVEGVPGGIVNAQNFGLQGDAYVQLANYAEALKAYEKALATNVNEMTTPYYLKKAGLVSEKLGDNAKALGFYKTISIDYASSMEGRDIQKFIGRLEQL